MLQRNKEVAGLKNDFANPLLRSAESHNFLYVWWRHAPADQQNWNWQISNDDMKSNLALAGKKPSGAGPTKCYKSYKSAWSVTNEKKNSYPLKTKKNVLTWDRSYNKKYFRRKKWRFWLKTMLNDTNWPLHCFSRKTPTQKNCNHNIDP
jgi:hypothetical protein